MWMTNITYTGEIDSDLLKSRKVIERSEKIIKKINSLKNGGLRDLIIEALYLHNNALWGAPQAACKVCLMVKRITYL